ncbi:MAG: CHAT domain-containing tetratricopeptide repeat protein [Candidatus Eremiobacterota bacterium]
MIKRITLIVIIISVFLTFCTSGKDKNENDLLSCLLNEKEGRMELLEKNKGLITRELAEEFLKHSFYHPSVIYSDMTFSEARKRYELAMKMAEILDDNELKGIIMLYRGTAIIDDPESAVPYYDKALDYFKKANSSIGQAWAYEVYKYEIPSSSSERKKICNNLEKAVKIYHKLGLKKEEACCIKELTGFYFQLRENEKALLCKDNMVKIYGEIYGKKNNKYEEYRLHQYNRYGLSRNYEAGLACEEKELKIISEFRDEDVKQFNNEQESLSWPKVTYSRKDKHILMASAYESLALYNENWRKYEKAIINYKKSLDILDSAMENSDAETELHHMYMTWKIMIDQRLAGIYVIIGKKDEALKYYEDSIQLTMKAGGPKELLLDYIQTGDTLLLAGMTEEAIEKFTGGFDLLEKMDSTPDWYNIKKSQLLYRLALCCFKKKDYKKAENYLKESINIEGETGKPWYDPMYKLMSEVYLAEGKPQKALKYKMAHPASNDKIFDLLFMSRAFRDMKNRKKSLEYAGKALKDIKKDILYWSPSVFAFGMPTWERYLEIGKILEEMGDTDNAIEAYKSSIDLIETIFNDLKIEGYEKEFMKDKIEVYERIIELLIKKGDERKAFEYNERARARGFLNMLASNRVDVHHGADSNLIKKLDDLEGEIRFSSDDEKLRELKKGYEEILEELKLTSPEYASLKTASPLPPEKIYKLIDEDTAILEYFSTEENLIVWVITKDNIVTRIISLSRKELKNKIEHYREEIAGNMTAEKIKSNRWKEESQSLYKILMEDIEKLLNGKSRLVIVPHRHLHYLPFSTLLNYDGQYLIEKYEIVYLPSLNVLSYCKEKNNMEKDYLVAFEYGNLNRHPYPPLPDSIKEVNAIKKLYPHNEIYREHGMVKNVLTSGINHGDIIHFATHGILDSHSPVFSKLVMADEDLEVHEIFDLKLSAYLVTLSSCQTGLGELSEGDELIGFSRAFIYAGTPSVCVSLWNVSDKATADLMERFYFYLKEHSKTEALRLAEMDMIKKYRHPFLWAPFVLIGDWM